MQYINTMKYYLALKKEIPTHATTWIKPSGDYAK